MIVSFMVSRARRDEGGDRRIDTHHIARFVRADIADDNRRLYRLGLLARGRDQIGDVVSVELGPQCRAAYRPENSPSPLERSFSFLWRDM